MTRLETRLPFSGLLACLIFLAAWGMYVSGASPSAYGGDAGELVTSSVALGISHAPGYPLHALVGKMFSLLHPWGGAAYRVNLSSAFLTALTVAGLFLFLQALFSSTTAALLGAALYAVLPIVWDQAQTTEVFALNNAVALGLLMLWHAARHEGGRLAGIGFWAWAFLFGAGLANHQTLLFLAPGFMFLLVGSPAAFLHFLRRNAPAAGLFFLLGLTLYLYLPLRAQAHPPVNFGDPHTLRRFFDVLTRREFGRLELHPAAVPFLTPTLLGEQARSFLKHNFHQLGWIAFLAGLLGLLLQPKRNIGWFFFWFFSGPFFFLFSRLSPQNTLAQWRLERFLLLPSLFLVVGFAGGVRSLLLRKRIWLAGVLVLGVAIEQAASVSRPWFRWNLAFHDFGRNVCASLAPQSLLLIDRVLFDEPTSCLMNRLLVERKRPDLRVIYRPGTLFELFYGEDVLEIPRSRRLARQEEREKTLWAGLDRPLAVFAIARENLPPFPFHLNGLLYQKERLRFPEDEFFIRRDILRETARDYPTRLILVHYPYWQAKAAF
ncbi:MAG: DUF2723 domain-containing protein, partial [Elusimicrobia bacterium]|nr:DUF2723 domain-containing protein [Elusimicrobiota bacterium]